TVRRTRRLTRAGPKEQTGSHLHTSAEFVVLSNGSEVASTHIQVQDHAASAPAASLFFCERNDPLTPSFRPFEVPQEIPDQGVMSAVGSPGTGPAAMPARQKSRPKRNKVFISYAHVDNESDKPDARWLNRLVVQLTPLIRQGDLLVW